ncbi:MAG: PP2C family protein-serine/threonine phosphatase [Solirubrobacterales bacterium]
MAPIDQPAIETAIASAPAEAAAGDFCLLVEGPDESIVAVVGDVVGCGPTVASSAAFVRSRCAAFAAHTTDPAQILELANAALVERPPGLRELASAVCLRYDRGSSTLSWAIAGHPPPLHLPTLQPLVAGDRNLLLGVDPDLDLETASVPLDWNAGVLAHSAGTIDASGGGERLGEAGLLEIVRPIAALPVAELARRTREAVLARRDPAEADDVCVLVLRRKRAA